MKLKDLIINMTKKKEPKPEVCEQCKGTGRHLPEQTCPTCNGTGKK